MGPRKIEGAELPLMAQRSHTNHFLGLRRFGPEGVTYEKLPDKTLGDVPHDVVQVGGSLPTQQVYIDKATHLISLLTVDYDVPNLGKARISARSWDYRAYGGVMLPNTATFDIEGLFTSEVTYTETVLNEQVDRGIFTAPE